MDVCDHRWRTAETVKTVNATCLRDHVVDLVASVDPGCWTACPNPETIKTNFSSDCFHHCYDTAMCAPF